MLDFFTLFDSCLREYRVGHQHPPLIALARLSLIVREPSDPKPLCVHLYQFQTPQGISALCNNSFTLRYMFTTTVTLLHYVWLSSGVNFLLHEECLFLFSLGLLGTACLFQSVWNYWLHLEESPWWLAEIASRLVVVSLLHFNDIIVSVECSAASLVATPIKTVTVLLAIL